MNLAFSALVIILLLVPGAVFLDRFTKGRGQVPVSSQGLQDNIVPLIIASVFVHALTILLFEGGSFVLLSLADLPLDERLDIPLAAVFELLAGFPQNDPDVVSELFTRTESTMPFLFAYGSEAFLIALGFGNWLRMLVRWSLLDIILGLPPRQSSWYYLLNREQIAKDVAKEAITKGEGFFETRKLVDAAIKTQPHGVYVDAVVEQAGVAYLYKGLLVDFVAEGETLKTLLLQDVYRRPLDNDRRDQNEEAMSPEDDERYYQIVGDYFLLDYKDIVTVNFDYIRVYIIDIEDWEEDVELMNELNRELGNIDTTEDQ